MDTVKKWYAVSMEGFSTNGSVKTERFSRGIVRREEMMEG